MSSHPTATICALGDGNRRPFGHRHVLASVHLTWRVLSIALKLVNNYLQKTGGCRFEWRSLKYTLVNESTELRIDGMTCSNCARHVADALRETPGVAKAEVHLDRGRAIVQWREHSNVSAALASVKEAGYEASIAEADDKASPLSGWWINVVAGSAATLPMMIAEWLFGLGMDHRYQWAAFLLATPVQFFCGARFYKGAWLQAKMGGSNMDTLVALGSTSAYLFSAYELLRGSHAHVYFMDSAAIITLISVGHWLESKVSVRAEQTLKSLLRLAPETARRIVGGREEDIPVAELKPGDSISLRPGDHIPTDGEVAEGQSAVDESMLTGESLPVEKKARAKLYAGTLNTDGRMVMRVTGVGEETALSKIIEVVQRAQNSRAQIQKLADRISNIFVPIVIVIAAATALWWWNRSGGGAAVYHMAAVLIIACPCAMGLATPIAIMAGTNAAAKRGILIRDGTALEKSGTITTILFDKTGTLTEGRLQLAEIRELMPDARDLAASLAAPSRHPLSLAISGISEKRWPLENWQEHRGLGISATVEGRQLRLGSISWLEIESNEAFIAKWTAQGASALALEVDGKLAALIALTDGLKENARSVVERLRNAGKRIALVTGDQQATAKAIAAQLGITEVYAEVRPEQKAALLHKLQENGERVAFVGDGINDSPALAAADLGIALGSGADAARSAADIVLLRAGLEAVPDSLELAQATLRTIKQNLFWAFFYNAAGVPLAALGYFSPMLSAAAMGISDLMVIGNALRLMKR